jgi:UDP:flavonoid glycosyltransferase YjiC (YdhE family)
MKIVIATTPVPGHVDPMLGIARILVADDHDVVAFTGSAFGDRINAIGAAFRRISASVDQDMVDPLERFLQISIPEGNRGFHRNGASP